MKGFFIMGDKLNENLEVVLSFFEKEEWPYEIESDAILTGFSGENSSFELTIDSNEEDIVTHAFLPVSVPKDKRNKVAEFLTRVNFRLFIGNLQMDFRDGEISYRVVLVTNDIQASYTMVRRMIIVTCLMFDQLHDHLMSVMYSDITPEEEAEKVDKYFSEKVSS